MPALVDFIFTEPPAVLTGYTTFRDIGEQSEGICYRDVTSPINELDGQSHSSRGERRTTGNLSPDPFGLNLLSVFMFVTPFLQTTVRSLTTTCPP